MNGTVTCTKICTKKIDSAILTDIKFLVTKNSFVFFIIINFLLNIILVKIFLSAE